MGLSVGHLLAAALAYLAALFLLALAAERSRLVAAAARHPVTYTLSLGVYASSWTYYGSVGMVKLHGAAFLAIYLGPTLACLAVPAVWLPVLRLARDYQLSSLADLFAFRYRGRVTGALVAVFSLVASIPYLAQQIRGIVDSARVLAPEESTAALGAGVCALLALFGALFGARHATPRERHEGLAIAVGFASVLKLLALLAVGAAALWMVLGGPGGLERWFADRPWALAAYHAPARVGRAWDTLLLLSFGAAFLQPRQYHAAFAEGPPDRALIGAGWGFPIYLLLLCLPVPVIYWAGSHLALDGSPDVFVLALPLALGSTALALLGFVGGVAAASSMVIVTTIALAAMALNHLVLPARIEVLQRDTYTRLLWLRRALIAAIVVTGYGFYLLQARRGPLIETGLASFVAFAQLLPGIFGLLFWKRATRLGFLAGLGAGALVWVVTAFLPLLARSGFLDYELPSGILVLAPGDTWTLPTVASLPLNAAIFAVVSLLRAPSDEEAEAARICAREALLPSRGAGAAPVTAMRARLAEVIGAEAAAAEVGRALAALGLAEGEARPAELRRLREQVERNLSGLFGPVLARMVVEQGPEAGAGEGAALADQLRFLEERLGERGEALRGTAAQLDVLRRYLRSVLEGLPLGVCALGPDGSVILWNRALATVTGVAGEDVAGLPIGEVAAPWGEALAAFAEAEGESAGEIAVRAGGERRLLRVHRAELDRSALPGAGATPEGAAPTSGGLVLMVEDLTEREALTAQLVHRDRLASIGRLAAGVAHEIGNPLTGIACVAQNLEDESEAGEVQERARLILEQTRRISAIVGSLRTFSHAGAEGQAPAGRQAGRTGRVERVPLAAVVDDAMRLVRLDRASRQVSMENLCPDGLTVLGERQRLTQVFVNLLTNACDASAAGGEVIVIADAEGSSAAARVIDHGAGIPRDLQGRVFEPFFTTKDPDEGTGLGLALVYSIVREHGGDVAVESAEGVGTTVTVRLPLAAASGETPARVPEGSAAR